MPGVISALQKFFRPYGRTALIIFLILLFLSVAIFAYFKYGRPTIEKLTLQSDIANANDREKFVEIYFFHVEWCPHCKRAEPIWSDFSKKMDNSEVNGYKIKCIDIDCTNDKDSEIQQSIRSEEHTSEL